MGVLPKSSILLGSSVVNHPAIGDPPFMETPRYTYIYICIFVYETQMTLVLKVLTHKIEGQPSKRGVVWVPRYTHYTYSCPCIVFDIYIYICMYVIPTPIIHRTHNGVLCSNTKY